MNSYRRLPVVCTLLVVTAFTTHCTNKKPSGSPAKSAAPPHPALQTSSGTTTVAPSGAPGTSSTGETGETGETSDAAPSRTAIQARPRTLATRGNHVCALIGLGEVACWGSSYYGQVAPGLDTSQPTPVKVPGITQAVGVAVSSLSSCALLRGGEIACWGNDYRKLWRTQALGNVVDMVVSRYGSLLCGLRQDGTIACTKSNLKSPAAPKLVQGIDDARALDVAGNSICALRANQNLECWKTLIPDRSDELRPTRLATGVVEASSSGAYHCYKTSEGSQYCGSYGDYQPLTPPVQGPLWKAKLPNELRAHVRDYVAELQIACHRDPTGYVSCSGINQFGEIGTGKVGFRATAQPRFHSQTDIKGIALGGDETCIYHGDHELTCENSLAEWDAPDIAGVRRVAASSSHVCAIVGGGQLRCWGLNLNGELGVPGTPDGAVRVPKLSDATHVAVGDGHTCASLRNRPTYCWGSDDTGQLGDGPEDEDENIDEEDDQHDEQGKAPVEVIGLSHDVEGLALGFGFSLARTPMGIFAWGDVPNILATKDVVSPDASLIAAGSFTGIWASDMSFCALDRQGTLLCGGEIAESSGAVDTYDDNHLADGDSEDEDDHNDDEPNDTADDLLLPIEKVSAKLTDVALGLSHACVLTK
ncbi:MAG: RCC1 domain-containing protein, partial [Nannocystaceae bacterium]